MTTKSNAHYKNIIDVFEYLGKLDDFIHYLHNYCKERRIKNEQDEGVKKYGDAVIAEFNEQLNKAYPLKGLVNVTMSELLIRAYPEAYWRGIDKFGGDNAGATLH